MNLQIRPRKPLSGRVAVPGDKSITHRALLLGGLGDGDSHIDGFLDSGDCRATIGCLEDLGIAVERPAADALVVHAEGCMAGVRRTGPWTASAQAPRCG